MQESLSQEELASRYSHYSKYGDKFKKAISTVFSKGVKKHIFTPSGRVIYTVVGSNGDEFLDPDKPFCSCGHFFFRVLSGQEEICYHFLSYRIALESELIDTISFGDDEYETLLRAIASDVLSGQEDKGDKST